MCTTICNINEKRFHHEDEQLQHAKNIIATPIYNNCTIKKQCRDEGSVPWSASSVPPTMEEVTARARPHPTTMEGAEATRLRPKTAGSGRPHRRRAPIHGLQPSVRRAAAVKQSSRPTATSVPSKAMRPAAPPAWHRRAPPLDVGELAARLRAQRPSAPSAMEAATLCPRPCSCRGGGAAARGWSRRPRLAAASVARPAVEGTLLADRRRLPAHREREKG
jgi:hypothetical protein